MEPGSGDIFVDMAGIAAFTGISDGIDLLKVPVTGGEPSSIDNEMLIVADLHGLARQSHQALDVQNVLGQFPNAARLKYDHFAALWAAKIVSETVHQQVIASPAS